MPAGSERNMRTGQILANMCPCEGIACSYVELEQQVYYNARN